MPHADVIGAGGQRSWVRLCCSRMTILPREGPPRACVRACCLPAYLAFRRPSRRAFANGHRLSLSAFLLAAPPSPLGPRPGPGLVASTLLA